MEDPVKKDGTDAEKAVAFREAYITLRTRLTGFVELPFSSLDLEALRRRLRRFFGAISFSGDSPSEGGLRALRWF